VLLDEDILKLKNDKVMHVIGNRVEFKNQKIYSVEDDKRCIKIK